VWRVSSKKRKKEKADGEKKRRFLKKMSFLLIYFFVLIRETDRFFAASGVQLAQHNRGLFHFHCVAVSSQLKSKVDSTLSTVTVCRVNLNTDGSSIVSPSHVHPSHSPTSRLLTSH
jgi:hypothetical protein